MYNNENFENINTNLLKEDVLNLLPSGNGTILDVGCGDAPHKNKIESKGYTYLGVDSNPQSKANKIVDMHKLPFKNNYFEHITSFAVLQYSCEPDILLSEIYRVLKPGGLFIGTVAFLEPYHSTYYHYTWKGLAYSLQKNKFEIKQISPSKKWHALKAISVMGLFPKLNIILINTIIFPVYLLHRIYWKLGKMFIKNAKESIRLRNLTGTLIFIAKKSKNKK